MNIKYHVPENINPKLMHVRLATWFGCGFVNPAPGTWGSLGAIIPGMIIYAAGGAYLLFIAMIAVTLVGWWAGHHYGKDANEHDSKQIVIDEVAGMWIAMLPAGLNPLLVLAAFITFRFFDILKPWPISWADKNVQNAWGVMLDDLMAGIAAFVCVWGLAILL